MAAWLLEDAAKHGNAPCPGCARIAQSIARSPDPDQITWAVGDNATAVRAAAQAIGQLERGGRFPLA